MKSRRRPGRSAARLEAVHRYTIPHFTELQNTQQIPQPVFILAVALGVPPPRHRNRTDPHAPCLRLNGAAHAEAGAFRVHAGALRLSVARHDDVGVRDGDPGEAEQGADVDRALEARGRLHLGGARAEPRGTHGRRDGQAGVLAAGAHNARLRPRAAGQERVPPPEARGGATVRLHAVRGPATRHAAPAVDDPHVDADRSSAARRHTAAPGGAPRRRREGRGRRCDPRPPAPAGQAVCAPPARRRGAARVRRAPKAAAGAHCPCAQPALRF